MKLDTQIHHVSGHSWKRFQDKRLKVKVITRPNALMAEVCIWTVWRRGSLVC